MDVVTFSDLQLKGKATVEGWLRRSAGRPLLIRRRDAEDLVLTTAARAKEARTASSVTARVLAALLRHDPTVRDRIAEIMPEVFPWVRFLRAEDVGEFATELVDTAWAAESIGNPAPVVQVVESWQHTAEVLADPELAAVLSASTIGDYGPVPAPRSG